MRNFFSFKKRHKTPSVFLFVVLAVVSVSVASCRTGVPDANSAEHVKALRAFYVGLAALQVGDDVRAEAKLKEATELAPEEPAGWADLGLLYLRQREFERAAERIERARQLAPDNAHIHVLVGLLESNRGKYAEAVAALRRAVELNPKDLKAVYALASEVEREGGETGETETVRLLEKILEAAPDNLAVQLDIARLSAKRGDAATLRRMVERLAAKSSSWPTEVQEQFKALQSAASGEQVRAAAPRVQFLRNVLVRVPEYRQSLAAVKLPAEVVGEPLVRPVRLASPPSAPAPPDESLSFNVEPVPDFTDDGWMWTDVIYLDGDSVAPTLAAARGRDRDIRIAGGQSLGFPGAEFKNDWIGATGNTVVALDFDYDFKVDLAMASHGGFRLYKQGDAKTFADVTARTALPETTLRASYDSIWSADIEADGDLDIVLDKLLPSNRSVSVLQNNGDGTFKEIFPFAAQREINAGSALGQFLWGDVDGDGDADAVLLTLDGTLSFYSNERGGQFRTRMLPQLSGKVSAAALGDIDGDGRVDLLALQRDGSVLRISDRKEGTEWETATLSPALQSGASEDWMALFVADFDNNGGLDLLVSGMEQKPFSRVLLGNAKGEFKQADGSPDMRVSSVADLNGDGVLDLFGTDKNRHVVRALGRTTKNYHWQIVRTRAQEATGDQRINSFGIGGEIEIRAGLLVQKQPINEPVVHFGLGEQTQTDVARIVWPNGVLQAEFELSADKTSLAEQRLKGSCPWVFAFDGERVAFVTDTLWRSPLGLKINAQDTAGVMMTEEWVKIRGGQLAPREGFYDVRITAELWETHYFDHVSLMVVDHPAATEISLDERFAVPPPALKVHATSEPRAFQVALDDEGRDVAATVRDVDGRYLDNFGRGRYQGITREHFVELELPADAPRESPLWLAASGWIHPTDSSINVAVSQGAQAKPQGLSLEVADGRGGWTNAFPALGFPAGKNKTVLIDLSNVFRAGAPRRLRLRTNLEIFWDRLAWAVALPETELKTVRLMPDAAELRYRGYSVVAQADKSSPELPDYQRLAGTAPRWRDLVGYHTRFGDVRPLLKEIDDRYVIMNAGDEMLFRFPTPAPVREGWVRDFVLVCDGWEKDGDYNTTFSKTVLPLPTHGNADYTIAPTRLEDDPVYRRHAQDWQDYHTRYVTPQNLHDAFRLR
ncbi:MAG TPA: FG-GAP-like repeat-containing protein [Pyrinomonadaceae bacterium]|jgi:Tfp pilus assembly protein PilF